MSGPVRPSRILRLGVCGLSLMLLAGLGVVATRLPGAEVTLGSYATSLRGRTPAQAFNAQRAAQALDGAVIGPGESFSFNRRVGPWNAGSGYRKAPASYDGELMPSYGGGVCQTSTTLYNAALLAGLDVVERHRHIRPPTYVAPGRDAAVAVPGVDLRLRNPYPYAVRLAASNSGDSLILSVRGRGPRRAILVRTEVQTVDAPALVRGTGEYRHGFPGFAAVTYRSEGTRERLTAYDCYPPVSRLAP